jgi:hypothetical protein
MATSFLILVYEGSPIVITLVSNMLVLSYSAAVTLVTEVFL